MTHVIHTFLCVSNAVYVSHQNHDDKLTFDEFLEGSKEDPTIIQALTLCDSGQA